MTKAEAIEQAINVLGIEAKPRQIQDYCSNTLGLTISYAYLVTQKNKLLRKQQEGSKPMLNPKISLNNLMAFKSLIEKEGGVKELKKILPKAKLLHDLVNEVGGWDNLEQIFSLME